MQVIERPEVLQPISQPRPVRPASSAEIRNLLIRAEALAKQNQYAAEPTAWQGGRK